jgi:hypothetical protein
MLKKLFWLALLALTVIGANSFAQIGRLSDFDSLRYIASHGDLIQAFGADAGKGRSHYEQYGVNEGRRITFDPNRYMASHPDLILAFGGSEEKATRHYIEWGYREGRTTTGFDGLAYIASYGDLIAAFGTDSAKATRHYIDWGYKEGRRISFDPLAYIASYADLIAAFATDAIAGAKHYIEWGYKEGRRILFDALAYIARYADIQAAFGSDIAAATRHYIQYGFREGRSFAPVADGTAAYNLTVSLKAEAPSAGAVLTFTNPNTGGNIADFKKPTLLKLSRVFVRLRTAAGEVVAEGYSDDDGRVSFPKLNPTLSYRLGVASAALTSDGLSAWVVNNRLPLDANAQSFRKRYGVYWVYSDIPATASFAGRVVERELVLPSGYVEAAREFDDSKRSSGPFLLLSYVVQHQSFLQAAGAPTTTLPDLTVLWSPTNRGAGDSDTYKYDEGIAGSSGGFFSSATGTISATGSDSRQCPCTSQNYIYLSGSQATEPMELTTAVPVHELTHFTQRATMRNASPGGPHSSSGEWQDFTLAQHEGFATGLSLMVGGTPVNGRAFKFSQSDQARFNAGIYVAGTDYRIRKGSSPEGWFQEGSFTSLIWRLFDPQGSIKLSAAQVIAPFYSSAWTQGVWAPSPWAYGTILKAQNPAASGAIDTLASSLNITLAGSDHWGSNERVLGNRTSAQTFPIYTVVPSNGSVEVCSVGEKADYNKLSNRRYLRFDSASFARTIKVSGPTGTVPKLYLDKPGGVIFAKGSNVAEARTVIPTGGTYGWVGECTVVDSASASEVEKDCSSQPYTAPTEVCWTITVTN